MIKVIVDSDSLIWVRLLLYKSQHSFRLLVKSNRLLLRYLHVPHCMGPDGGRGGGAMATTGFLLEAMNITIAATKAIQKPKDK